MYSSFFTALCSLPEMRYYVKKMVGGGYSSFAKRVDSLSLLFNATRPIPSKTAIAKMPLFTLNTP